MEPFNLCLTNETRNRHNWSFGFVKTSVSSLYAPTREKKTTEKKIILFVRLSMSSGKVLKSIFKNRLKKRF